MATAVIECLVDQKIKDSITAMSFDTTSSNTGSKSGACTHIEAMIGRDLLHLACRHHMMEIIAGKVLAVCVIPSTGPDILLFKGFQQHWKSIDQDTFVMIEDSVADREDILPFTTCIWPSSNHATITGNCWKSVSSILEALLLVEYDSCSQALSTVPDGWLVSSMPSN